MPWDICGAQRTTHSGLFCPSSVGSPHLTQVVQFEGTCPYCLGSCRRIPWQIWAKECHKITTGNRPHGRTVGGGVCKSCPDEGWGRKRGTERLRGERWALCESGPVLVRIFENRTFLAAGDDVLGRQAGGGHLASHTYLLRPSHQPRSCSYVGMEPFPKENQCSAFLIPKCLTVEPDTLWTFRTCSRSNIWTQVRNDS